MKRGIIISATIVAMLCSVSSVAEAKKKDPPISALQLQQIQTRDFEADKRATFAAVMSVLQDSGYRIQDTDFETGLITGIGSTTGKLTYNILWGFGKKKKSPIASVFIEEVSPGISRVRMSFVMATVKSSLYSSQPADEEPIYDAQVYTDAFEKVSKAVFLRKSMAGGSVTSQNSAPAAEPAAMTANAAEIAPQR